MIEIALLAALLATIGGMLSTFPLSRQARRIARLEAAIKEERLKRELLELEGRVAELEPRSARKFPRP